MFPSDHRLAAPDAVELREIVGETFVIPSKTAPTSRIVIEDYLKRSGLEYRFRITRWTTLPTRCPLSRQLAAVALLPVYPK